jgi:glycogen synthase
MDVRRAQKVLITADTLGGVWTYALELATTLTSRGVRVAFATMGAPLTARQRAQVNGLHGLSVYESSYKLEWMQRSWGDVDAAGEWLLAVEREYRPDVVHLNQFSFGALRFSAPTLLVAHSCVLSWWRAVHGEAPPEPWDEYRRRVQQGLAGATLVGAPTQAMLQTLASNYGYARPGMVLGNGRDASLFHPGPKQACILAAGRLWDEGKNLAALQAVASQLPWPVRLAGPTTHPDGGAGLPSWLYCLGELPTDELARHLSSASIYALPARYEPFGLSVLEAGLSGCALVLGDIPSLREIWGRAALYVAPNDHAALQATLRHLIDDGSERQRLGDAARARALRFTPARMADSYMAAYAQLRPEFASRTPEEMQCA